MLYVCAVRCGPSQLDDATHKMPRKRNRKRAGLPTISPTQQCTEQVLEQLQAKANIAETVLAAPCAHQDMTPLSLTELYDALPKELHAAAARGFLGAAATEWELNLDDDASTSPNLRTVQLLPAQCLVTSVRLPGAVSGAKSLQLLDRLSRASQLVAVSIDGTDRWQAGYSRKRVAVAAGLQSSRGCNSPTAWLRRLTPLSGLCSLEVMGCSFVARSLPTLAQSLTQLRMLTALVLEGPRGPAYARDDEVEAADDACVAEFAQALLSLTALARLGLPKLTIARAGCEALGAALVGLPLLRDLDLNCVNVCGHMRVADAVASAIVACTALLTLDLTRCAIAANVHSVRALCSMRARLQSVTLDDNAGAAFVDAASILAAPALSGLTRLSLVGARGASLVREGNDVERMWERLSALTELRTLLLRDVAWTAVGMDALARHISALVQLQALDIQHRSVVIADALAREVLCLPRLQWLACEQDWADRGFVVSHEAKARGLQLVGAIEKDDRVLRM